MSVDADSGAATRRFAVWERWDLDTIESLVAGHAVGSDFFAAPFDPPAGRAQWRAPPGVEP